LNKLDTTYDFVAVIDFLPAQDRKAWRLSQRLLSFLSKHDVEQKSRMCDSCKEFSDSLLGLASLSRRGVKFLLHFVGHGTLDGLSMPDGKIASWTYIGGFLNKIHPDTMSQAVLNMTCCWGIHGVKMAEQLDPERRFFGIIGPAVAISPREGYKINTKVYTKLIASTPINQIIREVNQEFGRTVLFGITSEGYIRLKVANDALKGQLQE
jgi:hypothetical protein